MIKDAEWERLRSLPGPLWRKIFDYRSMLNIPALKGIYRYHELIGSVIPLEAVVCLGEGHTPVVAANDKLARWAGMPFYLQKRRSEPQCLIQRPRHGECLQLSQLPHHQSGSGGCAGDLRLNRRYFRGCGPLRLVSSPPE